MSTEYESVLALFEPTLVVQALKEAVKKLNPQAQWRNPVTFIRLDRQAPLTTCISIAMGKWCDARQCAVQRGH